MCAMILSHMKLDLGLFAISFSNSWPVWLKAHKEGKGLWIEIFNLKFYESSFYNKKWLLIDLMIFNFYFSLGFRIWTW